MLALKSASFHPAGESEDENYEEYCFEDVRPSKKGRSYNNLIDYEAQFHKAISAGILKGVESAFNNGKLLIDKSYSGSFNALMTACNLGHTAIVAFLLESGANANHHNEDHFTPLMAVCFSFCDNNENLKACANLLFENDANVNAADSSGTTPLMYACKFGHAGLVQELINRGVNVNMYDKKGWTALFWAVINGNVETVQMLVKAGAKKKMKDNSGKTAYSLALTKKGVEKILAILNPKKYRKVAAPDDPKNDANVMGTELTTLISKLGRFVSSNITPKHKGAKLTLFEFLTVTDGELNTLGMKYFWQRRQTLEFIKCYHLQPWAKSSEKRMTKDKNKKSLLIREETPALTYTRAANQVLALHNRLVIIQATAVYLQRQWESEDMHEYGNMDHLAISFRMCSFEMNDVVKELQNILKSLDKMDKRVVFPADYIKAKPLNDAKFYRLSSMTISAVVSFVAHALWNPIFGLGN